MYHRPHQTPISVCFSNHFLLLWPNPIFICLVGLPWFQGQYLQMALAADEHVASLCYRKTDRLEMGGRSASFCWPVDLSDAVHVAGHTSILGPVKFRKKKTKLLAGS